MRVDNWQAKLNDLVMEWRNRPYVWGISDCGCFAIRNIEVMRGKEVPNMAREKGWLEAAKFMLRRGWRTVEDAMNEILGASVELSHARPGDIILYEHFGEVHLAVMVGSEALSPGLTGLCIIPKNRWLKAWSVD